MIILTYNDQDIEQREDGFVNLTQMAKANVVLVSDWSRQKKTEAYIKELSTIMGIPIMDLLISTKGGDVLNSGTWAHPLIAIHFAQWISPAFHIWCNQHIKTLIETGKTELTPPRPLPPIRDSIDYTNATEKVVTMEGKIPEALRQLLLDKIGDELSTQKQLPTSSERWLGVAQKAEEMGYPVTYSNRSTLGKFVRKFDLPSKKENRLCNGELRNIFVYLDSSDLESAIHSFFNTSFRSLKLSSSH